MEKVKGLYGSEFELTKACGYCKRHHCHLTVRQVKKHECLRKQCWHLEKREEHEWWTQRELIKQRRRDRKAKFA